MPENRTATSVSINMSENTTITNFTGLYMVDNIL